MKLNIIILFPKDSPMACLPWELRRGKAENWVPCTVYVNFSVENILTLPLYICSIIVIRVSSDGVDPIFQINPTFCMILYSSALALNYTSGKKHGLH